MFCSRKAFGSRLLEMASPSIARLCANHSLQRAASCWALRGSLEPSAALAAAQPALVSADGCSPAAEDASPPRALSALERRLPGLAHARALAAARTMQRAEVSIVGMGHCQPDGPRRL